MFLVGGFVWTLLAAVQFFFVEKTKKREGVILANLVILGTLLLLFYFAVVGA
jgi:hypothetical protein